MGTGARLLVALILLWLGACGGTPPAPIEDHSRPGRSGGPPGYLVTRGDTLYSIAFRYGLDFRRLAAANDIAQPYTIYVGQRLVLAERDPPARAEPAVSKPAPSRPPATPVSSTPKVASTPSTAAPSSAPRTGTVASTPAPNRSVDAWRWPSDGRLTRRFDGERHKGLDIAGKRGDGIVATAAGRVVYAGTGIVGYGLMLIVRHNDEYLSAYAHNDAVLVEEGDDVAAGQEIARMGSSGTDSVKLHFELRRRGRPVDPLTLLPAR